jgi:DNA transformation protein and related proteins
VAPDDIVELFSVFGPVTVRRMFGGAGIYADGTMFALIADSVIYLKAGDNNVAMFEREGLPPFTYARGQGEGIVMSYRRMPDRLYDDPEELALWARAALAVAHQPKPRKRPAVKKAKASRAKPARTKPKRARKAPVRTSRKRRAR